eukprot:gene13410-28441_t
MWTWKINLLLCIIHWTIQSSSQSLAFSQQLVYDRLIPCLVEYNSSFDVSRLKIPTDAEVHYHYLLNVTSSFRGFQVINGRVTMESLIPLFIQWVDIHANEFMMLDTNIPPYKSLFSTSEGILRTGTLYIAVSQDDEGISRLQQKFPNVISFSVGACGHIPIPLIKDEIPLAA